MFIYIYTCIYIYIYTQLYTTYKCTAHISRKPSPLSAAFSQKCIHSASGRRVGDTVLAAIGCNLLRLRRGPHRCDPNMTDGHGFIYRCARPSIAEDEAGKRDKMWIECGLLC